MFFLKRWVMDTFIGKSQNIAIFASLCMFLSMNHVPLVLSSFPFCRLENLKIRVEVCIGCSFNAEMA